jgi:mRNA interferase MazF
MNLENKKNFSDWILIKEKTEYRNRIEAYKYSVFWCAFGENIGSEVSGKGNNFLRPVVILKKFGDRCVLVAPLTSNTDSIKNNVIVKVSDDEVLRKVLISQIRTVDTKRLYEYMGKIEGKYRVLLKESFNKIVKI